MTLRRSGFLQHTGPVKSPMPETTVIDAQTLENLRALNPGDNDEFLREIAAIFFEDTPLRIAELDESLRTADLSRFVRAAHSIKGSSANLGATSLRMAAERLEHESRTKGLGAVTEMMAEVKAEFERAQTALQAVIGK